MCWLGRKVDKRVSGKGKPPVSNIASSRPRREAVTAVTRDLLPFFFFFTTSRPRLKKPWKFSGLERICRRERKKKIVWHDHAALTSSFLFLRISLYLQPIRFSLTVITRTANGLLQRALAPASQGLDRFQTSSSLASSGIRASLILAWATASLEA